MKPLLIIKHLYLGDRNTSSSDSKYNEHIHAVVSIGCHSEHSNVDRLHIPLKDDEKDSIEPYLNNVTEFIHKYLVQKKSVLIHCRGGMHRSPAFVVSYLAKYHGKQLEEAIEYVKLKRKCITIRPHFLVEIESWLCSHNQRKETSLK